MTASLYSFVSLDGTTVEINSDRINYIRPTPLLGNPGAITINVAGIDVTVLNTLSNLNSVLSSTIVPYNPPQAPTPSYPTVIGSAQYSPHLHSIIPADYFFSSVNIALGTP